MLSRGFGFSESLTYSTIKYSNSITEGLFAKAENNFFIKISIDAKNTNSFLIRLYQGLVEIHLPEKFHGLEQEEKKSLVDAMITWKFDWISNELYGLGKLSPKKGKVCFTDLLVALNDYLVYLKQHNNEPPLYPVFKKRSGSFRPFGRKGKIGSKSTSKRYVTV